MVAATPDIVLTTLLIAGTYCATDNSPVCRRATDYIALPVLFGRADGDAIGSPTKVELLRGIFRFVGYYALMWLIVGHDPEPSTGAGDGGGPHCSVGDPDQRRFLSGRDRARSGPMGWRADESNLRLCWRTLRPGDYLVMLIPLLLVFFLVERVQEDPIFEIDGQTAVRETGDSEGVWHFSRFWLGVLLLPLLRP